MIARTACDVAVERIAVRRRRMYWMVYKMLLKIKFDNKTKSEDKTNKRSFIITHNEIYKYISFSDAQLKNQNNSIAKSVSDINFKSADHLLNIQSEFLIRIVWPIS